MSNRTQRKMDSAIRNDAERFNFENKDDDKLIVGLDFRYNLRIKRSKYVSNVIVNFNKCLPRHVVRERILEAFKGFNTQDKAGKKREIDSDS